jgi:hypothetical protein
MTGASTQGLRPRTARGTAKPRHLVRIADAATAAAEGRLKGGQRQTLALNVDQTAAGRQRREKFFSPEKTPQGGKENRGRGVHPYLAEHGQFCQKHPNQT